MDSHQILHRITRQQSHADEINKIYIDLMAVGRENISINRLTTRLTLLEEKWKHFTSTHEIISLAMLSLDNDSQESLKDNEYFVDDLYRATSESYLQNKEKMANLKDEISLSSQPIIEIPKPHQSRLPTLTLPKFDGSISKWLTFKGLFQSVVIARSELTAVEKLQYLKTHLTGVAEQLLKNTELVEENFEKSWQALIDYHEDERLLINNFF